jgi:hypothetical protein
MMFNTQVLPNYREITKLSNSELAKNTKMALEEFILAIKQGENVTEKAQIYDAHQDERLKRLNFIKMKYGKRAS